MAMPIKETPVLYGKEATKFIQQADANLKAQKNHAERERVLKVYNRLKFHASVI